MSHVIPKTRSIKRTGTTFLGELQKRKGLDDHFVTWSFLSADFQDPYSITIDL